MTLVSVQFSTSALSAGLAYLGLLQFFAAILNVLPVPGFDGWGILAPYLPPRVPQRVRPIQPWAPLIFFALLWTFQPRSSAALWNASSRLGRTYSGRQHAAGRHRQRPVHVLAELVSCSRRLWQDRRT